MSEVLEVIYGDLADEFIAEGVVEPDIFQIVEKLREMRSFVLKTAPQGVGRTRVIIALNIEIARLSAIVNQFPQEKLQAEYKRQEEKKNDRSRSTATQDAEVPVREVREVGTQAPIEGSVDSGEGCRRSEAL